MAINQLPSGKWRVRVKASGRVVADRAFDFKRDAEAWEREQKRDLSLSKFVDPRKGRESVRDVAKRWMDSRAASVASSTLRAEGYMLATFMPATLGNRPIAAVRDADLNALYAQMLAGGKARTSVTRFRGMLSSMFTWCVSEGLIGENPVRGSRVPKGRGEDKRHEVYPFTLEGLRRVCDALEAEDPMQGRYARVLGLTGLRWGELCALRVRDVQMLPYPAFRVSRSGPSGHPIRTQTKGGADRSVPIPSEVVEIVRPLLARPVDSLLFTTKTGERLSGPNWKRDVKWTAHAEGRRVHDLRHTAATLWLLNGIDLKTVQHWLGHASAQLTATVYTHWMGVDADAAALAKFSQVLAADGDTAVTPVLNLRGSADDTRQRKTPADRGKKVGGATRT